MHHCLLNGKTNPIHIRLRKNIWWILLSYSNVDRISLAKHSCSIFSIQILSLISCIIECELDYLFP